MKRAGNLFEQIAAWDNLRLAVASALRGKRGRPDARQFVGQLDTQLRIMREQLLSGTVPLGQCRQFVIHDPKERVITAPCFRERVLHHAVMNVCEPHFDRWLIDDTFACRRGKGRIAALLRARQFAHRFPFFLKLDIRKYFDSVSHEQLLARLHRRFKDDRLLELLERIVRSFRGATGRGLPIGSLTSQHFANFYLGWFDRVVKEQWRVPGYVRYMDDMIVWGHSTSAVRIAWRDSQAFLHDELALDLKATPYLNRSRQGVDFLGCRVYPHHLALNRSSRTRFRRKLRALEEQYLQGRIGESQLQQQATSLIAFTRTPELQSWHFRRDVLQRLPVGGPKAPTA
jgi:RNA-directed DNA polymerase